MQFAYFYLVVVIEFPECSFHIYFFKKLKIAFFDFENSGDKISDFSDLKIIKDDNQRKNGYQDPQKGGVAHRSGSYFFDLGKGDI